MICHCYNYSKKLSLLSFLSLCSSIVFISTLLISPTAMANEVSGRWAPEEMTVQSNISILELQGLFEQHKIETKLGSTEQVQYLVFKLSGHKSLVALYQCKEERCGTIKMSTFLKLPKTTDMNQINKWNHTMRYTRAYIDKEGDPILEADIDLDGGAPQEMIMNFIVRQQSMIAHFAKYLGLPAQDKDLYAWNEIDGDNLAVETTSTVSETVRETPETSKDEPVTPTTLSPEMPDAVSNFSENSPNLSTFVEPEGYIYLTALKLDGEQPQGCPVIIEASNKTKFDLDSLLLSVRVHIKDEESPWSIDKLYDYPTISREGVEVDYQLSGVDCNQIDRVEILSVREVLVEGQPFPALLDFIKEGQGSFVPLVVAEEVP